jgi:Flp pilus assembly protein TadD
MYCLKKIIALMLFIAGGWQIIQAQNLQGKTIYVTDLQDVTLKFKSTVSDARFTQRGADTAFDPKYSDKYISINSKFPNFKPAIWLVMEGNNTHLFIVTYKEKLDMETETLYDFSTKERLQRAVQQLEEEKKAAAKNGDNHSPTGTTATPPETIKPIVVRPEESFDDIRLKANAEYRKRNTAEAEKLYRAALTLKPDDAYCLGMIRGIERDRNAASAKDREDAADKLYRSRVRTADSIFNLKLYSQSKTHYQSLLQERPNDPYPAGQIKKIDQLINDERFKSYMDVGRDALAQQQLDNAELAFKEALKIKPNNPEATKELKKIAPAKAAIQKQQLSQTAEQARQKRFDDTLYMADNMYDAGLYDEARKRYLAAKQMKPGHPHVARRLSQIDSIVVKLKADLSRLKRDSANLVSYINEVNKADKAFENKEYTKARQLYQSAQRMSPEEKYPAQRISSIDILLLQMENEKKDAAAKKIEQENKKKQYNLALKDGKAAMMKNDYVSAERHFLKVHELVPDDNYAASQLVIIEGKLAEMQQGARFDSLMQLGDAALATKKYNPAIEFYNMALIIKPNATAPKNQIKAATQELLALSDLERRQLRTDKLNEVLPYYKRAETLRVNLKYEEAYIAYAEFLSRVDTLNEKEYLRSERYFINNAKDHLIRLDRYKPKPKIDTVVAPVSQPIDNKKKKKRKNKDTSFNIQTFHEAETIRYRFSCFIAVRTGLFST